MRPAGQTTYNFEVAGDHTYFVGTFGVWVHNGVDCALCPVDYVISNDKFDAAAHTLANRFGGVAQVKFPSLPGSLGQREFDFVTDSYLGQTKPANFQLGSAFRDQVKGTFEAAQSLGKTPYFHFEGPPDASVLRKIDEYGARYGITPVINISPL